MTVEVVAPSEFQSAAIGGLNSRRGTIVDGEVRVNYVVAPKVKENSAWSTKTTFAEGAQGSPPQDIASG
ncbi:hypothetical protein BJ138DRAFT_1119615 [Hygrophoropsis aurantiaca]|uniref:Uncharacterized protein n=2 Tax=Hygrophoropsis aurantiaca TaxID=72124 RepID=A0ACB7ZRC8_9AGAM|nr:hypothetical protein BJ138DRAFT_180172 [Hygrophoropsis aurantiaca]KAH7904219.1 hypothetical protein BJ138DRAFT_1119615 [Hygrophoropsis aurantiaca]